MNWKFIKKTFCNFIILAAYPLYVIFFFISLEERIEEKENFSIFLRIIMILVFAFQIPDHLGRIRINKKRYNSTSQSTLTD